MVKFLLLFFLLFLPTLSGWTAEESKPGSSRTRTSKAPFAFSMDDISDRLVTVSCEYNTGHLTSNGYIAHMDGETDTTT